MSALVGIQDTPLDVDEVECAVSDPGAGAIVSFVGRVRNHNAGMPVTRLEYEAYPSMAKREMQRIVQALEARFPGTRLAVLHRIGKLEVGDAAVVCAASAAHRAEAFEACRALIDDVKADVPIWKREHGPDGPYWVGWEDARCHGQHGAASAPHACDHDKHAHGHVDRHGEPLHARSAEAHPSVDSACLSGLRVAWITVSDSRTRDTDEAGAIAERFLSGAGANVERRLVRDEAEAIASLLESMAATAPDAVILSGGTGIGPRDVTIEAIKPLLERELDGFGETFRRLSFDAVGTRAVLSRAIAGVRGRVLIFALPGSSKAVTLALEELIVPLLPHARAMLAGGGH